MLLAASWRVRAVSAIPLLLCVLALPVLAATPYQQRLGQIMDSKEADSARLESLFRVNWEYTMTTFPEWATYVGYPGQNTRWTDYSRSAIEQRRDEAKTTLQAIRSIARENLAGEQQISHDLFLREAEKAVEGAHYPEELLALNQMWGVQTELADQMSIAPASTLQDYRDRLARLKAAPELIAATQALLSEGIRMHITQPGIALEAVPEQIRALMPENTGNSPLYKPFLEMSEAFPAADRAAIQLEARQVLESRVYPALQELHQFMVSRYLPNGRESPGFASLPNGRDWYAFLVRNHTTTRMTPEEIHRVGLNEVARIRAEMEQVREQEQFNGDLNAFNRYLNSDARFFYDDADKLLDGYRDIARRIDARLPELFGHLPRLSYQIRAIPDYQAASAPAGYYKPGSVDTGRPGYFEANTADVKDSPKWQMEALVLHEAVPGHHLQISIAQELDDIPEFRRQGGPSAFVEGWGLYAEGLGSELGLYQDPNARYGRLSFEMLRAVRLVVDTGIHAKGWSRDQAMQYMRDNTLLSSAMIVNEIDRYSVDPGQALAYKIGELKFRALRKAAESRLGERFRITEFHDQLLGSGALPMDMMERKMTAWMDGVASAP